MHRIIIVSPYVQNERTEETKTLDKIAQKLEGGFQIRE